MECSEAQEHTELFVLNGLRPDQQTEMAEHLAECAECRAAEAECRRLVAQVRGSADRVVPASHLEQSIRAAAAATATRVRVRRVVAGVVSLAALLLLCLTVGRQPRPVAAPGQAAPAALERWQHRGAVALTASLADDVVRHGNTIYLLRDRGTGARVASIDAATGSLRWESESESCGYLAADDDRVFALAAGGQRELDLIALNASDGKLLWRQAMGRLHGLELPCRPTVLPGARVCWTNRNTVNAIDAQSGTPIWTRSITDEGHLACAAGTADALFVVSGKRVRCVGIESGDERWAVPLAEPTSGRGQPLVEACDGRLYFVQRRLAGRARLCCMDLSARRVLWQQALSDVQSLLATARGVYVRGRSVRGLDGQSGRPLWDRTAVGCGPLSAFDGLVHFVDSSGGGRLVAVDELTGHQAWALAGLRSCSAFTKVGTTGYIKTQDGVVHAFTLRS